MTRIISALADIGHRYDAAFVDVWGCIHDGLRPYADAVNAMIDYRAAGRRVVLVTNSPRSADQVVRQLDDIGVAQSAYDAIATSGDAAREALLSHAVGQRVHHVGPQINAGFFAPGTDGQEVELVPFADAEGIVCTGLFDDISETPDNYRTLLADALARNLPMLCVNPDIHVDRGSQRLFCAGAIADAYQRLGGRIIMAGKPSAPIYALARTCLGAAAGEHMHILCIGDGPATDVTGAAANGFDCLFVTGGLAAVETGTTSDQPDPKRLRRCLASAGLAPAYAIGRLR